jgi:hypothetical protein
MPDGAQAWKMIKTPGSHTDRIAQACDRCRSKKIRCDGKRPHCSQCAAVGFECKTSDKLSRRAFPRGYTESLEDRVRQLESENNKLLNLLDIKDEQMEMLAKVESVSNSTSSNSNNNTSSSASPIKQSSPPAKLIDIHNEDANEEEAYVVHQINTLSEQGTYKGSAAGGVFIEAFLEKLKTKNTNVAPLVSSLFENVDAIYQHNSLHFPSSPDTLPTPASMNSPTPIPHHNNSTTFYSTLAFPNRMSADKLTATYFHEWNSMFAVLDQYAYLEEYQSNMSILATSEITGNYDALKGKEMFFVVALLVLSLGSIASKDKSAQAMAESNKLEQDWKRVFTPQLQNTPTLATVQALVLAELYSLHTGNKNDVWHYRMLTVSMTQRLGLHRCHKSLKLHNGKQLSFYDQEMRRRCFWVAYSLDCFSAAQLGAPRLFNDEDIECALPSNIDDELLVRGEKSQDEEKTDAMTQMSCPLSVIHFSKCLANILQTIYSSVKKTHPYKTVVTLEDQLESWRRELPTDLKFDFANGAPTAVLAPVHQKSPLLFMFYHYARILIHMPAVSAPSLGTNAGTRGSASCVAVMQSAKVLIQVGNYLKHRSVIPTVPMNPSRSYVFFGALVLYGAIDYSKGGALLLDIKKTMSSAMSHLYSDLQLRRPGSLTPESYQQFEEICDSLLNVNNRKNSTASEDEVKPKVQRKRRTSIKSTKQQQQQPATPQITPPVQQLTPPPVEPVETTFNVTNDKLRENAINDLLFLNSIMSNTSKEDRRPSTLIKNEELAELPIDMFDFVTRPYSEQSGGLISSDNTLFMNSNDHHIKHESQSDLLEFLSYGSWNEERSVISSLI